MTQEHQEPTDLVVAEQWEMPDKTRIEEVDAQINEARKLIRKHLVPDVDFGVIEGTDKPSLHKTGAEKIAQIFGTRPDYEVLHRIDDWDKGLFAYEIKCSLVSVRTGNVVAQGVGECNTYEPRYRYRKGERKCPDCGEEAIRKSKNKPEWYCWQKLGGCGNTWPVGAGIIEKLTMGQVENPDRAGQRNTVLKMSKIRALRDAALGIGALSAIYTQDIAEEHDPAVTGSAPAAARATVKAPSSGGSGGNGRQVRQNGNGNPGRARQDAVESTASVVEPPEDPSQFKNVGDLMNAAMTRIGLDPAQIVQILEVHHPREVTDLQAAWQKLSEAKQGALG